MLITKEILVILSSNGLGRQSEAMKDKNCFAGLNHLLADLLKSYVSRELAAGSGTLLAPDYLELRRALATQGKVLITYPLKPK